MGEELVNSSSPGEESTRGELSPLSSYTEVFYQYLPTYMAMGMSPDEFWNGDVLLVKAYREAYKLKRKIHNEEMWLQGFYVYQAIGAFAEILPAFPAHGAKVHEYMKEPVPLDQESADEVEERQEETSEQMAFAYLNAWADRVNSHIEKGGEE